MSRSFASVTSLKIAAVCVALIGLGACTVGPKYRTPAAPTPSQYKEANGNATERPGAIAYSNWWLVFHDADLNRLEQQVDQQNQDIKAAVARVDQAQAFLKISRSSLFPTVTGAPAASRSREAQNRPNNGNTGGHAATYNDFQVSVLLGYELDVWGRVRHTIEAATAAEQGQQANARFVRLVAETGVAINYYGLRELDSEHDVLSSTLFALNQSLNLTKERLRGGLASEYDVDEAQALYDETEAQTQQLEISRAQLEHVIAVLTGQPASTFSLPANPLAGHAPSIPSGLPSELLKRRPDIIEAERAVASANANVGVARAEQFPQFTLTGAAGFESVNPASLLNWQNSIASLGTGVLAPIFTGGRLKAQVNQSRAAFRESLAQYESAVLDAYQQVEDQLVALRILTGEAKSQGNAVEDTQRAEDVAVNRYKAGLVSYLDVATTQAALLSNQRVQTQIAGQQMVASVALIKALGGGWLDVPNPDGQAMTAERP